VPGQASAKPVKKPGAPAAPPAAPEIDDDEPVVAAVTVPDFTGMGVGKALDRARELHIPVDTIGTGRVIAQDPPAGPASSFTKLTLRFSDETRGVH